MKKINASDIINSLQGFYQNYDYKLENSYVFEWESDFFCVSRGSGYIYETEVKISRADFKADFTKHHKHALFKNHKTNLLTLPDGSYQEASGQYVLNEKGKREWVKGERLWSGVKYIKPAAKIPNRFYYACPKDLLKIEDLPPYAGLLYYDNGHVRKVKEAPLLHKNNLLLRKRWILLEKFYHQGRTHRHDARSSRSENERLSMRITEVEKILDRYGINKNTGELINASDTQIHGELYDAYRKFTKYIADHLKIEIKGLDDYKLVREYMMPLLSKEEQDRLNMIIRY